MCPQVTVRPNLFDRIVTGSERSLRAPHRPVGRNYRSVLRRCAKLADLCTMPLEDIQAMLGDSRQGKSLYEFLHAQCPTVAPR